MRDIRPKVEGPDKSLVEVVKIVAKQWNALDEGKKKKYQEEFKKEQVVFNQKMAQYVGKLTNEQKESIREMKVDMAEKKERRQFRKKITDLGKPKRAKSAFLIFLQEETKKKPRGDVPYQEFLNATSTKWNGMTEKAKESYMQASAAENKKYQEALGKWEKQMVQQGHLDVVRQEALLEERAPKPRKTAAKP